MYLKRFRSFLIVLACLLALVLLPQACTVLYHGKEAALFLGRMTKEPRRVGAVLPTSTTTSNVMAREALKAVSSSDEFIVELGPGTGCITRALLEQGVAPDKLICVELDPELHQYMTEQFPELQIILGDAAQLKSMLAERCGKVGAIVSAIPMINLPTAKRKAIVQACYDVLKPQGKIVQITYRTQPAMAIPGLKRAFAKFVFWNLPPAFIWSLTKEAEKQTDA